MLGTKIEYNISRCLTKNLMEIYDESLWIIVNK